MSNHKQMVESTVQGSESLLPAEDGEQADHLPSLADERKGCGPSVGINCLSSWLTIFCSLASCNVSCFSFRKTCWTKPASAFCSFSRYFLRVYPMKSCAPGGPRKMAGPVSFISLSTEVSLRFAHADSCSVSHLQQDLLLSGPPHWAATYPKPKQRQHLEASNFLCTLQETRLILI